MSPSEPQGLASPEGPTEQELAAVVAAADAVWPRPAVVAAPSPPPRWRFAGRWWTKPVPVRRDRPW